MPRRGLPFGSSRLVYRDLEPGCTSPLNSSLRTGQRFDAQQIIGYWEFVDSTAGRSTWTPMAWTMTASASTVSGSFHPTSRFWH
jgi:hypothetical protein